MNRLKTLLTIVALTLATTACDGPVGPEGPAGAQGPEGPQGPSGADGADGQDGQNGQDGQRGPRGPAGEDGNANVTLYIFDGHDFTAESIWVDCLELANEAEWEESQWSVFLRRIDSETGLDAFFPVPSTNIRGGPYDYITAWDFSSTGEPPIDCEDKAMMLIQAAGDGIDTAEIHIIQTRASNVEEAGVTAGLQASPESVLPADLDMTDYDAIVEYYGLDEDDIVRM